MTTKPYECRVCGSSKFYLCSDYRTGTKTKRQCQDCIYRKTTAWVRGSGRQNANASRRRTWAKIRDVVFAAYGGRCSCCGEDEKMFLTVDHVNGDGTKHRKEIGGADKLYRHIRDAGFPKHFRIMCHNCNSGRWRNGGICPHEANKPRLVVNGYLPE